MSETREYGDSSSVEKEAPVSASVINERRRAALAEIDNAKFSWFHVKICLVAGVGFFTDAYDIFAINIASVMIGYIYGGDRDTSASKHPWGKLTANQELGLKVATPVGTLVGQLLFGWLADRVGRKRMYGIELMIIIVATFGQALAGPGFAVTFIGVMVVWRFIMGVGIGGDYPLSAVISSEFASTKIRGRMMTAVFAAQGFGNFTAALVALIVTVAFKNAINRDIEAHTPGSGHPHVDYVWRLLIGLGCVPAAIALYFRLTISETPRYTMDIDRNIEQAQADVARAVSANKDIYVNPDVIVRAEAPKASWADFIHHFSQWKNLKILIGTSYSWFALDIAFYGLGLNSSIVLEAIGFGDGHTAYDNLKNVAVGNLIISAGGLIPGYWVSFLFIDTWGRKPIQFMGFILLTIIFICMGFGYDAMQATEKAKGAFVFLYCMANFFQNFGPNTTTFVVPGEVFPTRYRSTAHGISAASGKLGAIIAQVGFARLKDIGGIKGSNAFVQHILEIFALFMLTGIASTFLIPETKQKSLEELSNESQDGFVKNAPARRGVL